MKNGIEAMITDITATTAEAEDYTGEDGLLYCGKCHTPKEAYFAEGKTCFGRDRHPTDCDCQRAAREKQQAAESRQKHLEKVEDLKRRGFTDPAMRNWTFEHDNGRNPQTETARFYVESWETMQAENIGYLFWGGVGTGKSYLAACIANALMEKEVAVCMTNFATILGDLAASFEGRNEYISRLCSYPLLILDDFGMERGTEYGLEQVYSVIDSRYRSGKPLIATTNLTLEELQHPQDTPHARIYDRLTSMCAPVRFTGSNFRKETAQEKLERLKQLMKQRRRAYDRNQTDKHHQNRPPPGLCDGNPHGQLRPYRFRLLQAGRNRHRSRQDDESAGSGSCYTKNGDLTDHKEADLTLLPLYRQPPHVVQSRYGIVGLAVGNGGFYVKTDQPTTNYRPLPKTIP